MLVLEGDRPHEQPIMLSEFGGFTYSRQQGSWGYSRVESDRAFEEKYTNLMAVVNSLGLLAGFCYTQFADTYQETNGLLYADRTPKFPLERMASATMGGAPRDEHPVIGSQPITTPAGEPAVDALKQPQDA
jgi:hypothetical protein